jgi:hypothetical protein
MQAMLLFVLLPHGFSNRDLRQQLAPLLGIDPSQLRPGRMTYDLRRLRLPGLIKRLPASHRYQVTDQGLKTAMFYCRTYNRILRPGLSLLASAEATSRSKLGRALAAANQAIHSYCDDAKLAA